MALGAGEQILVAAAGGLFDTGLDHLVPPSVAAV
jgi:hypothetical protein